MPRARWILGGLAIAALCVLLLLRARSTGEVREHPTALVPSATGMALEAWDGGALSATTHDRRVRDELRRRIIEGLLLPLDGGRAPAVAEASATAPAITPPRAYGENDPLDRQYIQHVVREELVPLARACYEQLLEREPDAGGRVSLHFGIVGDAKLGGYVDDASIDAGTPEDIQDPEMQTCMRESMMSIAFAPPAKGGAVTVDYPLVFSP